MFSSFLPFDIPMSSKFVSGLDFETEESKQLTHQLCSAIKKKTHAFGVERVFNYCLSTT